MVQEEVGGAPKRPAEPVPPEFVTREQLRQHLNALGFPITAGTLNQLCAPARGEGPPIAGYWGTRPVYRLEDGLAWAHGSLRRKPYQIHPGTRRTEEQADQPPAAA
jgi:hypothetical protein